MINAINDAKKVYDNKSAKQDEVDLAVTNLNSAINTFKGNKITVSERNSDGSYTRAYVEKYYRQKFGHEGSVIFVSVSDASNDEFYNNEVCYLLNYYRDSGLGRAYDYYIGSKTLNQYDFFDVIN